MKNRVETELNWVKSCMEVDTISEETFKEIEKWTRSSHLEIESQHAQVKSRPESRSYTTESVKVIGTELPWMWSMDKKQGSCKVLSWTDLNRICLEEIS